MVGGYSGVACGAIKFHVQIGEYSVCASSTHIDASPQDAMPYMCMCIIIIRSVNETLFDLLV